MHYVVSNPEPPLTRVRNVHYVSRELSGAKLTWLNRLTVVVLFAGLIWGLLPNAWAQSPDEQYVQIFNQVKEGDTLNNNGQSNQALAKYLEARTTLQRFQRVYPNWNEQVVNFRLTYLEDKIATLSGPPAATSPVAPSPTAPASAAPSKPAPAPGKSVPLAQTAEASEAENQLNALKAQVHQLQADKTVLEAKLKEALSAQPAAIDPGELSKAQERIKILQKENDLLKVSLNQEKTKAPARPPTQSKELSQAQQALADANRKLTEQAERTAAVEAEKKQLQTKLDSLISSKWNAASVEATRKALDEANRQLAEERERSAKLALEKQTLEARTRPSGPEPAALAALQKENQLLKKQVAELKAITAAPAKAKPSGQQLAQAQAQIAALESDKELLRLEKLALENRMKQLASNPSANTAPPPNTSAKSDNAAQEAESARIKLLEQERDDLQKKLAAALKEASHKKGKGSTPRVEDLENQLAALRARLEVFEARQVPYTAEELALFKRPEPKLGEAEPRTGKKSVKELPPGAAPLVAEAQRYFSQKRMDKAEEKYLQVLKQDDKNVYTLANLAAIQLELGHLEEAEKHVQRAISLAPDDAYSLTILGYLKFKQSKYDDSLNALSRAAKLDPENAEIQNYLGLTLSQKGLRGPAETALRKAIQLDPNYGSAHNNLAVVYVSQQPPAVELARWHYQKALAVGHPRNPELEKLLDTRKVAERK